MNSNQSIRKLTKRELTGLKAGGSLYQCSVNGTALKTPYTDAEVPRMLSFNSSTVSVSCVRIRSW